MLTSNVFRRSNEPEDESLEQMARKKKLDSALVAALKEESATLATEIADKAARKAQVDELIAVYEGDSAPAPKKLERKQKIANRSKLKDAPDAGPFYGMSLPEAGTEQLRRTGEPHTAKEIWNVLKAVGFKTSAEDPVKSTYWALRRREQKRGDVVLIGDGKWGLRAWYTDERFAEIKASLGHMPGRNKEEHIRRMKKGIANLKARGAYYGRPVVMTEEKYGQILELIEGGKTAKEACAIVSVSASSYHNAKRDNRFPNAAKRNGTAKGHIAEEKEEDLLTLREGEALH